MRAFLPFDTRLVFTKIKRVWLSNLPQQSMAIITECLLYLDIPLQEQEEFLTLMLTTLPGWAAYIHYRTHWADATDLQHPYPVTQEEYLALRLILTCLLWPNGKELLSWHRKVCQKANTETLYRNIQNAENSYRKQLIASLSQPSRLQKKAAHAQLVFCIDVRSEPFRRALEVQGHYETYGFAGFFGVAVTIENAITKESYASCPVLLKPIYKIVENPNGSEHACQQGYQRMQMVKKLYQSVKYNFTTPFALVESLGIVNGLWMALRSFSPSLANQMKSKLKNIFQPDYRMSPSIDAIPFEQQVSTAMRALRLMSLTSDFAPLVIFCGHGSVTQNNAYATALDCGACGGRHGAPNARILADILNQLKVRQALQKHAILIPEKTYFLAAEHNTTTDEVEIYDQNAPEFVQEKNSNSQKRFGISPDKKTAIGVLCKMGVKVKEQHAVRQTTRRSQDWAQVRPEWGLARNAAFIVGPRELTQTINLEGRAFLHSYDWQQDADQSSLTTILTAPMVVAQWINCQYLFSTVDNVAFGGGSKITKNITGKIAIMQGNASDLMNGLPLQSVYSSDKQSYHAPLRLTVIVYAPRTYIESVISQQSILKKLFGNGWAYLICLEPNTHHFYTLERTMTWTQNN